MTITEAVISRINQLLVEKEMTKEELIQNSGLHVSTLESIYKKLSKSVNLSTVFTLAKGFGMSACEFLNNEVFQQVEVD